MYLLETARLWLRPFTLRDLDTFAPICSDPEVMGYYRAPWSRKRALHFILLNLGMQRKHGYSVWAVLHKADGRFIGYCGLTHQAVEDRTEMELGYMLARPYWGRGLATEGARASRDYAFQHAGLKRLISLIHPENTRSMRIAEKNGMHHEREIERDGHRYRLYAIDQVGFLAASDVEPR